MVLLGTSHSFAVDTRNLLDLSVELPGFPLPGGVRLRRGEARLSWCEGVVVF